MKFAGLYAAIAFLLRAFRAQGWTEGLLPLSFVSGLTDLDAISLSLAREGGETPVAAAAVAVTVAAVANTLLKAGLAAAFGSAGLRRRITLVLGATATAGAAWALTTR